LGSRDSDVWATAAKQCLAAAFYVAHAPAQDAIYADQLLSQAEHAAEVARSLPSKPAAKRALAWYVEHLADTRKLVESLAK